MVLKKAFSSLFGIACTNDAFVTDHVEIPRAPIQWNVRFARAAHY